MSVLLAIYHYINVLLGVINLHYTPLTNCYNLYHWPTMIYCALMNLFCIICLHGSNYIFLKFSLICQELELTQILDIILIIVDHFVMVALFVESWLKRRDIYDICNELKILFQQFSQALRAHENRHLRQTTRNILIRKCLCAFFIICYQLYQINEVPQCEAIDRQQLVASHYFDEVVFFCAYFVDMNIYICWLFIYICEESLKQRLRQVAQGAKLMFYLQAVRKDNSDLLLGIFGKWRKQMGRTLKEISVLDSKLRNLVERIFYTFQLQFLLFCLSFFINLIYLMVFAYLVFANFDEVDMQYIIIFIITSAMKILNVFIFFSMYELLSNSFNSLGVLVYKIDSYAFLTRKKSALSDTFDRNLELLMLQVQPHQLGMNICGFFDLNNSTCLDLLEASLTSVISLIQILVELKEI